MYAVAERLDPDSYLALARATYREMVASGITSVGEFHYLHHQPDGTPYDDPNAMGHALVEAAQQAGLRIRLLDTCYLSSGFGDPPQGVQRRFSDGTADRGPSASQSLENAGAAIHSVRAVPDDQLRTVVEAASGKPLHVHLSEQTKENDACVAAYGATPTQLLADHGVLGPLTSAVHATHLTDDDIGHLGLPRGPTPASAPPPSATSATASARAGPSTTRGSPLTLGSDSHAVIDLFEEMRAVELDERLATLQRGHWSAAELLTAATPTATPASGTTTRVPSRSGNAPTWSPSTPRRPAPQAPAATSTPPSSRPPPPTSSRWSPTAGSSSSRATRRRSAASSTPRSEALHAPMTVHRHHEHRRAGHQRPGPRDERRPPRHPHQRRDRARQGPCRLGRRQRPTHRPPTSTSTRVAAR